MKITTPKDILEGENIEAILENTGATAYVVQTYVVQTYAVQTYAVPS